MKLRHFKAILTSGLLMGQMWMPDTVQSAVSQQLNRPLENRPLQFFGGTAAGYGNVSSTTEYASTPDGPQVLLGGSVSYQIPNWVFEVGGGWNYTHLSGTSTNGAPISIRTRSGYADASPRYRLGQNWQCGPAYSYQFGTDTRLGPSVGASTGLSLYGLRLGYETVLGRFPFRVALQGLHSLGADGRNGLFTTLGLQVGFPLSASGTADSDSIRISQASAERTELRIALDPRKVFFATDSSHVRTEVQRTLRSIGLFLAEHPDAWGTMTLAGHADIRGTAQYNLALSKRRSDAVRAVFAQAGVNSKKMKVGYYGFHQPADPRNSTLSWAKNRRVELVFKNVKDTETLALKLKALAPLEIPGEQW